MKILWVVGSVLPDIANQLKLKSSTGGSWLQLLSQQIKESDSLSIIFPTQRKGVGVRDKVNGIEYIEVYSSNNSKRYSSKMIKNIEEIIVEMQPDIIHIWGTENEYSYCSFMACYKLGLQDKVIVSIQGLMSVYEKHFYANLPSRIIYGFTLRDLYYRSNIWLNHKNFVRRGEYEIKELKLAKNVIGRTDWDKACTQFINPDIKYYFCNETLRNVFYNNRWEINKCKRHTIFFSQTYYQIKGFHILLQAVNLIKNKYPDLKIYTTGKNILESNLRTKLKYTSYEKYLKNLIRKFNLEEQIFFKGSLNAEEMCMQYLNANVFVSASSIENSPNSVGEAMILGVPVITSDVGGVKNLLKHNEEGFIYQADAPYMLAYYIDCIFQSDELACIFSEKARKKALITHDPIINLNKIKKIYDEVKEDDN